MRMLLLILWYIIPGGVDLQTYRQLLDQSVNDKTVANQFYRQMKDVRESDAPVLLGFRAMSEFMLCKHLVNPLSKLSHFNKGKALLENALKRDPDAPELLFFRLSTQSNIPVFLHYYSNINSDKERLISYLEGGSRIPVKDKALYVRIKAYLLVNQHCTAPEIKKIKSLY